MRNYPSGESVTTAEGATTLPTDRSSNLPSITKITKQPRYVSHMNVVTGGYAP
jgi:hypothetical protein